MGFINQHNITGELHIVVKFHFPCLKSHQNMPPFIPTRPEFAPLLGSCSTAWRSGPFAGADMQSANRTASKYTAYIYIDNSDMFADVHMDVDIYIYTYRPTYYCVTVYLHNRRTFRSQISDNMDRWKSRGGKSQRGEEQKREDQRKSEKKEDAGRETLCFFPCWGPSTGSST